MGSFSVIWSETAELDLLNIISYTATDSPQNARETVTKIKKIISILESLPDRGRVVAELKAQGDSRYHELLFAPWRIIYRVSKQTVYLLALIDSRQNVEDILLARFINHHKDAPHE